MAPLQHQNVLPTNDQLEGHAHLIKQNEGLTRELNSMRRKCDEYEKTIVYQANEIRNLRESLSLNICEQCKKELDHMKSREMELCPAEPSSSSNNPPQKPSSSHFPVSTSLKRIAAIFKSKSRTLPSVPSSSHAPSGSATGSTNHQHVSTPGRSHISRISSTVDDTGNAPSQPSQNLSRISHPGLSSVNDNGTNTVSQEPNWSIVFNHKVKKELDLKSIHTLPRREAGRVRFSPEGKYLAVAYIKEAFIYDVATGRLICVLADLYEKRNLGIQDLRFSPDGRYLAISYWEHIYIWEISRKLVCKVFKSYTGSSLDLSSDGRLLVSGSCLPGTFRVWNMRDGTSRVFGHDQSICSVVFSLDGLYVITGGPDGMIGMWNLRTGHLIETVKAHNDWVSSLALMSDGKGLVSGSSDKTLAYWDVGSLTTNQYPRSLREDKVSSKDAGDCPENNVKLLRRFIGHTDGVYVTISPNGRWIISGSRDHSVGIWDAWNAEMQCMLQARSGSSCWADVSPTGNHLAASSGEEVRIWRYEEEVVSRT